jgi:O-antigen biosynthesis protein WbqP
MAKRIFDILISLLLLCILAVPLFIVAAVIKLTSRGPVIHWSKRVGTGNRIFLMPKFRSMYIETPQVATHLLTNSDNFVTPVGKFLRKTSLDEIPQLYSVLIGEMSLVGPRPALFNQDDLVELRTKRELQNLRPGITGWAQINGRDDLPIPVKVEFDAEYKVKSSLVFDCKILFLTVFKVLASKGIKH